MWGKKPPTFGQKVGNLARDHKVATASSAVAGLAIWELGKLGATAAFYKITHMWQNRHIKNIPRDERRESKS